MTPQEGPSAVRAEEVSLEAPSGSMTGYLAGPASMPRAAVVVVHESFGRAPEIEAVCRRLAAAGYLALMPDLFGSRFKPFCVVNAMKTVRTGKGPELEALWAAAEWLEQASGLSRARIGVVGFCLGAGLALAAGRAFAAVSASYGDLPPLEVMRGIGPTVALFGARDRAYRGKAKVLEERLKVLGVEHEVHVLSAGHAFLTDGRHPVAKALTRPLLDVDAARDAAAREEGWQKILAFLGRALA